MSTLPLESAKLVKSDTPYISLNTVCHLARSLVVAVLSIQDFKLFAFMV